MSGLVEDRKCILFRFSTLDGTPPMSRLGEWVDINEKEEAGPDGETEWEANGPSEAYNFSVRVMN